MLFNENFIFFSFFLQSSMLFNRNFAFSKFFINFPCFLVGNLYFSIFFVNFLCYSMGCLRFVIFPCYSMGIWELRSFGGGVQKGKDGQKERQNIRKTKGKRPSNRRTVRIQKQENSFIMPPHIIKNCVVATSCNNYFGNYEKKIQYGGRKKAFFFLLPLGTFLSGRLKAVPPMAMKLAAIRIDTLIASRKGKKGRKPVKNQRECNERESNGRREKERGWNVGRREGNKVMEHFVRFVRDGMRFTILEIKRCSTFWSITHKTWSRVFICFLFKLFDAVVKL